MVEFLAGPFEFAGGRRSADVAAVLAEIGDRERELHSGQVLRAVSCLLSSSPQFWPFARHLFKVRMIYSSAVILSLSMVTCVKSEWASFKCPTRTYDAYVRFWWVLLCPLVKHDLQLEVVFSSAVVRNYVITIGLKSLK